MKIFKKLFNWLKRHMPFWGSSQRPPQRIQIGLNANPSFDWQQDVLEDYSIRRIRMGLNWLSYSDLRLVDINGNLSPGGTPPYKTAFEWFVYGIEQADALGIEPLLLVSFPPPEFDTLAEGIVEMPLFMIELVQQLPGRTWQILNEMDGEDSFSNGWFHASDGGYTQFQRGELYGTLLGPVYDAMKAYDPSCRVVTGGFASKGATDQVNFYNGLVSEAPNKFEAVCVHFYGIPADQKANALALRAVLGKTPLWCTEFGSDSAVLGSEAAQYDELAQKLADIDQYRLYDRSYVYNLFPHNGLQLFNDGGSPKAAAALLLARTGE